MTTAPAPSDAPARPPLDLTIAMKAHRILETVLYADDLTAAERFYETVMGLPVASRFSDAVSFRCGDGVLLVFDPELASAADRSIPPHGAVGRGHVAFTASAEKLDDWRRHLEGHEIPIESEMDWGIRGRSIYFRDPAGNLVELAPPGLWG